MENRNTVIALVLMLVVWFGYSLLFPPQPPQEVTPIPAEEERLVQDEIVGETTETREETIIPAPSAELGKIAGRQLMVDTDTFRAVLTSSGARLIAYQLKKFQQDEDADSPPVTLVDVENNRLGTLRLTGTEGFGIPADLPYAISVEEESLRISGGEQRQVVFTGTTPGGLTVQRTFTFRGNGYDFDHTVRIANHGGAPIQGNLLLSLVQPWDETMEGGQFEFVGPATLAGEDVHTDKVEDVAESARIYSDALWTAFENKYFISAAVPMENAAQRVLIEKEEGVVLNQLESTRLSLGSGETARFDYLFFYGPRDLEILKEVNYRLEEAIDFGFFSILALPLRYVLTFFYGFVGNYGVAIILLTVVIKLLFWPLTNKSYASMKAMQKLQPDMQKIREKYKNDRERMNRELMEMYKTHRVNPLGGCLPMLVQIPVFFALYKVLLGDIALRHAPFMLWITDLSAKDPYYITPILMGGSMFLQQKMTPTTLDPVQAKMFMIMPVVFTFLFLNFPAGLVIYWLTNNLLTIAQQTLINRKT